MAQGSAGGRVTGIRRPVSRRQAVLSGLAIWAVFFATQWLRSAVPRVRIDQLIEIGWKGLLVLSFANLILTAVIVGLIA